VPEPVIVAQNLVKKYKDFAAVDDISFEVAAGESFGLLGPNGAGKSTTMRMVGAVSTRTGGNLRILGLDPDEYGPEIRSRLGVVPQSDNLDTELRVREEATLYSRGLRGFIEAAWPLVRDERRRRQRPGRRQLEVDPNVVSLDDVPRRSMSSDVRRPRRKADPADRERDCEQKPCGDGIERT